MCNHTLILIKKNHDLEIKTRPILILEFLWLSKSTKTSIFSNSVIRGIVIPLNRVREYGGLGLGNDSFDWKQAHYSIVV